VPPPSYESSRLDKLPTFNNQTMFSQVQPMQQPQDLVIKSNVNSQLDNTQVINTISQTNFDRQIAECPPVPISNGMKLFPPVNQGDSNLRQEQKRSVVLTPVYN
jgi:hypothetical protein